MRKLRAISLIILLISVFVTVDLGFNYLQAITAQISGAGDGIAIYGIFARKFLGDRGWSYEAYLKLFATSTWTTLCILLENTLLAVVAYYRRINLQEAI